ncbi:MAG: RNA 2',3'-cyclic phosphodiesterase, partial [Nitrospinota bacterium]
RFLGTTDKKDIPVIARAVARVALKQEPFEISFQGLGVFSLQRKRKVIWLGVAGRGASALRVLKRSIDCSLNEAGFRLKREKFMPHFTLGRTKYLSEKFKEAAKKSFEARGMEVNTIGFFKSETRASGVVYSEIESFRLG